MDIIKRMAVILTVIIFLLIYLLGYYYARKDHLLVRRINVIYTHENMVIRNYIIRGNFGAGKGGILVPPAEINFCYYIFTPLRLIESRYQNMKSDKVLQATNKP